MFICHCRGITDRVIREAVAHGARSVEDVALICGAGTDCQGCWPAVRELLDEANAYPRATVMST